MQSPWVDIGLTTHDAGGLTSRDINLARQIARAYARGNASQQNHE